MRATRAVLLLCLAAAAAAAPGCGKKGPPLAPVSQTPGRPSDISARRVGDQVEVTFTVPSANNDDSKPADLERVDVYAYTALSAWDVFDIRRMTRIASIRVRKPPEPVDEKKEKETREKAASRKEQDTPPKPEPPLVSEGDVDQGAVVTVRETLTAELQTPLAPDQKPAAKPAAAPAPDWFDTVWTPPLTGPIETVEPKRYYVAFAVSTGGTRGGASPRPGIGFGAPPPAPPAPALEVTEAGIVVSWDRPAGVRLPYQEPAEGEILPAKSKGMPAAPDVAYVVYALPGSTPAVQREGAKVPPLSGPLKLTVKPVKDLSWTDAPIEFGVERCYDVRAVQVQDTASVESTPSAVACATPLDVFPPPAPASLAAVAGEGAISLIWKNVDALDLAGYIVMRGPAPSGELAPLFETPIRESTYRDATAKTGVRYVYAVVAVDSASPPNRSALSNKVEETAR